MYIKLQYDRTVSAMLTLWRDNLAEYEKALKSEIDDAGLNTYQRRMLFADDPGRSRLREIVTEIERRAIPQVCEIYEGESPTPLLAAPYGSC